MNIIRAVVEGLGSKSLTGALAGIIAALLVPLANKYLSLGLTAEQFTITIVSVIGPILLFILKQWHVDVKTGGVTTTAALMSAKAAKVVADIAKDGTMIDTLAKAVLAGLATQGVTPSGQPSPTPAPVPAPAPVAADPSPAPPQP